MQTILESEEARTRAAYLEQPDAEGEANDWSDAEAWEEPVQASECPPYQPIHLLLS